VSDLKLDDKIIKKPIKVVKNVANKVSSNLHSSIPIKSGYFPMSDNRGLSPIFC